MTRRTRRRRTRQEEAEEEEEQEEQEEEEDEEATDIKSNNPHLAGGEKELVPIVWNEQEQNQIKFKLRKKIFQKKQQTRKSGDDKEENTILGGTHNSRGHPP